MPSVRMRSTRALALSAAVATIGLVGAPKAGAATTIGQTFTPPPGGCGPATNLQSTSPGSSYAAPSAGVITSWSHEANATPPELVFKVARHGGGASFTIIGESQQEAMTPDSLNTFPTRIPVEAGDVIGFFVAQTGSCMSTVVGFGHHYQFLNLAPGVTADLFGDGFSQLDVSAELEPDTDGDGYGDETQDPCPSEAGTDGPCPTPAPPTTSPPTTTPSTTNETTGRRAAALKKCKRLKKKTKKAKTRRKKCRKKAKRLPV
jgi:hypothetical protein